MKTKFIILVIALISLSCKEQVEEVKNEGEVAVVDIKQQTDQTSYATYGEKITAQNLMAVSAVKENYKNLKAGDTTTVKFKAPIDAVCKSKGCWMRLDLGEEEVFVKFKDYAFFVPTDATGEAIVEGKAFVEETSVQEQQHLALDAGMSADDIAAIIAPKRELKLMATGVLMEK
ncbi:DUF4920 domain-containing protein [uncultured Dokdonia sp.]|uniref:DUF4920 domain-containing protein n=1 Tax=uncultured Dokdonia sp. TaxID=575653 RepID=UPI002624D4F8|nr:DUF4920 domain-containing protein [uncultured Dokdonia sp.]